jgi:hypothetical protein
MVGEFSTPLIELPTFLSTISMVGDEQNAIVQRLIQAERKSPSVYDPARALFLSVLEGKLSLENAMVQAWHLNDETQRKCAVQILDASRHFLQDEHHARTGLLPNLKYHLPNGLPLNVTPVRLRHFNPERLLVLHFWRTPLSEWQLRAAAAVLRSAVSTQLPQLATCEVDFISVAFSQTGNSRQFQRFNWTKLKPLNQTEIDRFWNRFLTAWTQYQRGGPRKIKRRKIVGLFD